MFLICLLSRFSSSGFWDDGVPQVVIDATNSLMFILTPNVNARKGSSTEGGTEEHLVLELRLAASKGAMLPNRGALPDGLACNTSVKARFLRLMLFL